MTALADNSVAAVATSQTALPAAGSSFYIAMRILPRARREAMYAVYAFCRAVDDIADSDGPRADRMASLERWRGAIDRMAAGQPSSDAGFLAEPTRRFGLKREDFHAVIDGMEMDVTGDIRAPDWATLDLYCDRVASAVGRLSVRVFGLESGIGDELAYHLGRALQLTNILRDIDEDAAIDRLYLPREALEAAGLDFHARSPGAVVDQPGIAKACKEVALHAERHFREAARIMTACPRKAVRAPRLMEAAYNQILRQLIARGWSAPRRPVKISKLRLLGAVLRHGIV